jgi:hypothetical protein
MFYPITMFTVEDIHGMTYTFTIVVKLHIVMSGRTAPEAFGSLPIAASLKACNLDVFPLLSSTRKMSYRTLLYCFPPIFLGGLNQVGFSASKMPSSLQFFLRPSYSHRDIPDAGPPPCRPHRLIANTLLFSSVSMTNGGQNGFIAHRPPSLKLFRTFHSFRLDD